MSANSGSFRPKYQPDEDRPCPRCEQTLPPDAFHAKTRNEDGSIRTRQTLCKECARDRNRERYGHKPRSKATEGERARRRRLYYLRARRDPARVEELRAQKREQARRRRERAKVDPAVAEAMRAASERYRQKIMSDDEMHAMRLVDQRIRYRAKNGSERLQANAVEGYDSGRDMVDASPFVAYISAAFPNKTPEALEAMLGIPARRFRDFQAGQSRVSLDLVDRALTIGLGRPDLVTALYPWEEFA